MDICTSDPLAALMRRFPIGENATADIGGTVLSGEIAGIDETGEVAIRLGNGELFWVFPEEGRCRISRADDGYACHTVLPRKRKAFAPARYRRRRHKRYEDLLLSDLEHFTGGGEVPAKKEIHIWKKG